MRIIFDLDGSLCHSKGKRFIRRIANSKRIFWPFIFLGILVVKPRIDQEMVSILNTLHLFGREIWINPGRPKQTKNHTEKYLNKNGILFYQNLNCLGTGKDIALRKVEMALQMRVDIVVDDDEEVLQECTKRGIPCFDPQSFKKLFYMGVIK